MCLFTYLLWFLLCIGNASFVTEFFAPRWKSIGRIQIPLWELLNDLIFSFNLFNSSQIPVTGTFDPVCLEFISSRKKLNADVPFGICSVFVPSKPCNLLFVSFVVLLFFFFFSFQLHQASHDSFLLVQVISEFVPPGPLSHHT